ncbi:MAG: proton-conducting membrane transporter, partial [Oscillospiraceae bacterium]|nr:proton-conducting membrane transporter [Oscillospiraceae bacterium]
MKTEYLLLVPVFFPMLCGAAAAAFRLGRRRRALNVFTVAVTALTLAAVVAVKLLGGSLTLIRISPAVELTLAADGTAGFFSLLGASAWLLASVYACRYMTHEEAPGRFFSLWLVCLGAVLGADLAGNAVSLYLFYELVTLSSFPLVLHDGTPEAVNAGMKYLFYSVAGAFLALFGIAALFAAGGGGAFAPG